MRLPMNVPMARSLRCRWMTFELEFHKKAQKEWNSLPEDVRKRLKKKLEERLATPRVRASKLSGHPDRYKIKLMRPAIRLVYQVYDDRVTVQVIAIGKRSKSSVYKTASER